MKEKFLETLGLRLTNLMAVKSILTIAFAAVFIYLTLIDKETSELFDTIFVMIISFYFGTQQNKKNEVLPTTGCPYVNAPTLTQTINTTTPVSVDSSVPSIDESAILEDDTCV